MWMNILSIIVNIAYFAVLNAELYTDTAVMPAGTIREWHRSPVTRLYLSDQQYLFYVWMAFAAVSIITSILLLLKVRSSVIKTIWLISTSGSTVLFVMIMIVTAGSNAHYA